MSKLQEYRDAVERTDLPPDEPKQKRVIGYGEPHSADECDDPTCSHY